MEPYLLLNEFQIETISSLSMRWENHENHRYYRVVLCQDLFGDWVLTKAWGGISQTNGRVVHYYCASPDQALHVLKKIIKKREQRGYILHEHTIT